MDPVQLLSENLLGPSKKVDKHHVNPELLNYLETNVKGMLVIFLQTKIYASTVYTEIGRTIAKSDEYPL
jgi:bifunctional DNase/RNase